MSGAVILKQFKILFKDQLILSDVIERLLFKWSICLDLYMFSVYSGRILHSRVSKNRTIKGIDFIVVLFTLGPSMNLATVYLPILTSVATDTIVT